MDVTTLLGNMTGPQLEEVKLAAHAALARTNYLAYTNFIDTNFEHPKHIRFLCEKLQQVESGEIKKLVIILPFRHGKSEATSGKFPAYCIGKKPKRVVMLGSNTATLAETFSVQNRDTIDENQRWPMVFPNVRLNSKNSGRGKWGVVGQRESLIAAGVGGSIIGLGCWLLLLDDIVKNYSDAISDTVQEAIWQWYTMTARTRLTPDGRVIVIGTRWAENDFIGRLLASDEGKDFTILHLPAFSYGSEEDYVKDYPNLEDRAKVINAIPKTAFPDALGRPKGEPLWPERWDKAYLEKQRLIMGHDFESAYQGNPSAPQGRKFQTAWFRGITPLVLSHLKMTKRAQIRSYDLAWSSAQRANYTVGLKATLYKLEEQDFNTISDDYVRQYLDIIKLPPVILVIEDILRFKKEWDDAGEDIVKQAIEDGEKYHILVEAVASQSVGIKSLKRDRRLWKHTLKGVYKFVDKEINAKYALALGGQGICFIQYPTSSTPPPWEKDLLDELGNFPNGKDDDQVDALSQLVNHLQPQIDEILQATTKGIWETPFMKSVNPQLSTKLPQEFVEQKDWVGQTMGWFK